MYVIKKGQYYVKAQRGQKTPYTSDITRAAIYKTKDEALKNACGNERVIYIELRYTS